MRAIPTSLPGVLVLEPKVFGDERGSFFESFNQRAFDEAIGQHVEFVQDNQSHSHRGVLRGLHYQLPPRAQGKLVRAVSGRVFDVAVDMRRESATFGRWLGVELTAAVPRQLWIPAGFAHGFLVLSETADFLYKTTDFYAPETERSIRWDDRDLAIDWPDPGVAIRLSDKDRNTSSFEQAPYFG